MLEAADGGVWRCRRCCCCCSTCVASPSSCRLSRPGACSSSSSTACQCAHVTHARPKRVHALTSSPHKLHTRTRLRLFELFPILLSILLSWFVAWLLTIGGAYNSSPAAVQAACRTDQSHVLADSPWFRVPYPGQVRLHACRGAVLAERGPVFALLLTCKRAPAVHLAACSGVPSPCPGPARSPCWQVRAAGRRNTWRACGTSSLPELLADQLAGGCDAMHAIAKCVPAL